MSNGVSHHGDFHQPVMIEEVLAYLHPGSGGTFIDTTLGGGGHAEAILEASAPDGTLIGIDRDEAALEFARDRLKGFGKRVHLVHGRMDGIAGHLKSLGFDKADGILADLGMSSRQLDDASRGFSFRGDAPLDMRMDRTAGESAAELLARSTAEEIEAIIREFGEDRYARRIANAIADYGEVKTTGELAEIVVRAVPPPARRRRIHAATQTFQALRIAVNDEMGELDRFLEIAPRLLAVAGRLVVISYHSLEDRRVKQKFRELERNDEFKLPRRKTIKPSADEVEKKCKGEKCEAENFGTVDLRNGDDACKKLIMNHVTNTFSSFSAVRRQPVAKRSLEVRRRYIKQVVILIALVLGFALLFVWTRIQVVQLGYEVSRLRKEMKDLTEQKNHLEAEVAKLLSPNRLERVAIEHFGMRLPRGDEIVFITSAKK